MTSSAKSAASVQRGRKNRRQKRFSAAAEQEAWALLDEAGLSREVGFMMRMAQLALVEHISSRTKGLDLAFSQMTILRIIYTRPALTQQRIANAIRINKANLTPLINELAANGLLSRRSSATNPKAHALYLTSKGERSIRKAKKLVGDQMLVMADIVDPGERERLIQSLRKIAVHLPQRGECAKSGDIIGPGQPA